MCEIVCKLIMQALAYQDRIKSYKRGRDVFICLISSYENELIVMNISVIMFAESLKDIIYRYSMMVNISPSYLLQ